MKLKSIGAILLALSMVPGIVSAQGLMAKLKAKMSHTGAAASNTMNSAASSTGSKMGGMFHHKSSMGAMGGGMMGGMHTGSIIGNKNTKVYHMPGDKNLPDEKNRVYFSSASAAEAAGYHAAGSKGGSSMGSGSAMGGSAMGGGMKHHKSKK
jgi:hypothetical protein